MLTKAYDIFFKYRFIFTQSQLKFINDIFTDIPNIYASLGKKGYQDLKLKFIRKNLFTEIRKRQISDVTSEELGIELPEGFRYFYLKVSDLN